MTKSYQGFEGDLELANSARSGLATLRARDSAGAEHTLSLDPDTAILSIDGSPISYVVESGSNSDGFYRKHSDGFIEQWGSPTVPAGAVNSETTRNFPVPFTDLASVNILRSYHSVGSQTAAVQTISIGTVSVSQFKYHQLGTNFITQERWYASGY